MKVLWSFTCLSWDTNLLLSPAEVVTFFPGYDCRYLMHVVFREEKIVHYCEEQQQWSPKGCFESASRSDKICEDFSFLWSTNVIYTFLEIVDIFSFTFARNYKRPISGKSSSPIIASTVKTVSPTSLTMSDSIALDFPPSFDKSRVVNVGHFLQLLTDNLYSL